MNCKQYSKILLSVMQDIISFLDKENHAICSLSVEEVNAWMKDSGIEEKQFLFKKYFDVFSQGQERGFFQEIPKHMQEEFYGKLRQLKIAIQKNAHILEGASLASGVILSAIKKMHTDQNTKHAFIYNSSGLTQNHENKKFMTMLL